MNAGPRWRRRPTAHASHTQGYRWWIEQSSPCSSLEFVHRTWPARPGQLAPLRAEVRRWLAPLGLPERAEDDLVLAVSEAASNCVEHAYRLADRRRHRRVDLLDRTPRGLHPHHRPRPVAHSVRPTHPTGPGNRDHAAAHRVRSDPPRRLWDTGVPASAVAGWRPQRGAPHAHRVLVTGLRGVHGGAGVAPADRRARMSGVRTAQDIQPRRRHTSAIGLLRPCRRW